MLLHDSANLTNQILPIFSRKRFSGFDYELLDQPLRLASMMLDSDALVPYINITAYGDLQFAGDENTGEFVATPPELWETLKNDQGESYNARWYCARTPKPGQDEVNYLTRLRAKLTISQLANMVDFALSTEQEQNYGAIAEPLEGPLNEDLAHAFPWGCRTRIELNPARLDLLKKLTRLSNPRTWLNSKTQIEHVMEELVLTRFEIATTLLHELGHALTNAAMGHCSIEPFYMDAQFCEAGHELENQLFGGKIVREQYFKSDIMLHRNKRRGCCRGAVMPPNTRKPKPWLGLMELPSCSIQKQYAGYALSTRGEVPDLDVIWRVPIALLESYFTDKFWLETVRQEGAAALKPLRCNGWLFRSDEIGVMEPVVADELQKGNLEIQRRIA